MLLGIFILLIAILIYFSKMPAMRAEKNEKFSIAGIVSESKRYPHLLFGVIAMFFYIGGESCTAGFFIPYITSNLGVTVAEASKYLSLYYSFAAIMGLVVSIWLLKYVKASNLVSYFGIAMIIIYLICIFIKTGYNEYLLASLGLFLSVMFPTIFSLAIEGIGKFAGKASALLNFAIVGGSVFPPIQGRIADNFGVTISYLIPCFCYCMITLYALFFTRDSLIKRGIVKDPGDIKRVQESISV
jgi:FHS family L-fucose permease-like MFS transporter